MCAFARVWIASCTLMCTYYTTWWLTTVLSSNSRRPSEQQACMQCAHMHSGKTLIHIKINLSFKKKKKEEQIESQKISMMSLPTPRPLQSVQDQAVSRLQPHWSSRRFQSKAFLTLTFSDTPASTEEIATWDRIRHLHISISSGTSALQVFTITELLVFEWMGYIFA